MPEYPERIDNIKDYLFQATVTSSPSKRQLTQTVESWMNSGYTEDPRIKLSEAYNSVEFDDILNFYKQKIKSKPIAIGIVANKKLVDKKQLKTLGKVINVSSNKIFKY